MTDDEEGTMSIVSADGEEMEVSDWEEYRAEMRAEAHAADDPGLGGADDKLDRMRAEAEASEPPAGSVAFDAFNSPDPVTAEIERHFGTIRRFHLVRRDDESGVSGTGVVASGVQFWDGAVALMWRNGTNDRVQTLRNGWALYPSMDGLHDTIEVHGHDGKTQVVWEDNPS